MRVALALLAAVLLLGGCKDGPDVVIDDPVLAPYDGPLDAPDAATLALGCEWNPQAAGGAGSQVGSDPVAAVSSWRDAVDVPLPDGGYQLERVEDGRALVSFAPVLRRVAAIILAEDRSGWGVESWAACDPSEFGVDAADRIGIGVWTGVNGLLERTSEVVSFRGSQACGQEGASLLRVGLDEYVRDGSAGLPADAVNRELRRDGRQLWIGEQPRAAYLVPERGSDIQRWAALEQPSGCDFGK